MPNRLAAWVHVRDLAGRTQAYGPDDEVPEWAARQITNPAAWGETGATPAALPDETTASSASGDGVEAPPRTGRGSGAEAWRRFAERRGVDVEPDASREDVIAACERAGVIDREE